MEVFEVKDMRRYLDKLFANPQHFVFQINTEGTLMVDGKETPYNYLAYRNGQWFGSKNNRRASSEALLEKGTILFAVSDTEFWMQRDDGSVEYASTKKELSNDAIAFIFVEMKHGICLFAVDGRIHTAPLKTLLPSDADMQKLAAIIVISLVRQYDPDCGDAMDEFWFAGSTQNLVISESGEENQIPPWE